MDIQEKAENLRRLTDPIKEYVLEGKAGELEGAAEKVSPGGLSGPRALCAPSWNPISVQKWTVGGRRWPRSTSRGLEGGGEW